MYTHICIYKYICIYEYIYIYMYTSNGQVAVNRKFDSIELVSCRGLGMLFGPAGERFGATGELFGPTGALFGTLGRRSEHLMNLYNICASTFR